MHSFPAAGGKGGGGGGTVSCREKNKKDQMGLKTTEKRRGRLERAMFCAVLFTA